MVIENENEIIENRIECYQFIIYRKTLFLISYLTERTCVLLVSSLNHSACIQQVKLKVKFQILTNLLLTNKTV